MSGKQPDRAGETTITNARVVTPERVIDEGHVVVADGRIQDVGPGHAAVGETIDVGGRLVLPGLIDLHGDEIERDLVPRDGARVDAETALVACDRRNVSAGITTKFHAVAFEEAPDDGRSVALAEEVVEAASDLDGLVGDARIHARCELGDEPAVDAVVETVDRDIVDLVSLMHHRPNQGQFEDTEQFARRYTDGGEVQADEAARVIDDRRDVSSQQLDERTERVLEAAREADVVVASHDDDEYSVATMAREEVSISEYPVTLAAARRASRLGLVTAMGAPNLVRGGSLWGNLDAIDAIRAGCVDVLCTDYHPPSLLESVFVETGEPLHERVARVTEAPADAVGLTDRGRIRPGARADLIVVDEQSPSRVRRVFVEGSPVLAVPASS